MVGLLACLAAGGAEAADADGKGAFLLIDGGAPAGQPRLTGCDRAMSDLHAALDKAGTTNTVLIAPTAGGLRQALLGFGGSGDAGSNAVLFCGYASEAGGNVFALGSDFSSHDDPALSAVSVRAFSRMSGGKNGVVMLDLHPMAVEGASVAAIAGALNGAAGAWSADTSLSGTRIVATDRQPGDASLIDRVARSGATTPATVAQVMGQADATPAARPAPPAAAPGNSPPSTTKAAAPATEASPVPAPVSPPATAVAVPTTTAEHASAGAAPVATTPAAGQDVGSTPDNAATKPAPAASSDAGTGGGTIPLAPKPAPDVLATRKRVHVDPAIRRIQVALLARGLFNGRVNGVNSPDTRRGIQHFQAMLGHPATGQLTADETKQLTGG